MVLHWTFWILESAMSILPSACYIPAPGAVVPLLDGSARQRRSKKLLITLLSGNRFRMDSVASEQKGLLLYIMQTMLAHRRCLCNKSCTTWLVCYQQDTLPVLAMTMEDDRAQNDTGMNHTEPRHAASMRMRRVGLPSQCFRAEDEEDSAKLRERVTLKFASCSFS